MKRMKSLFAALIVAATVAVVPASSAQTVHFVGAGSSAMFQGFAVAAYNDLGVGATGLCPLSTGHLANGDTCTVLHWSNKTSNGFANMIDDRTSIPPEGGNVWIVWVKDTCTSGCAGTAGATDIWADISVDSTVGVRGFLGRDASGNSSFLKVSAPAATAGTNQIAAGLFTGGAGDSPLDADVIAALNPVANGHLLTAGLTDIRPEDALLATNRILGTDCPTGVDSAPAPASCGDTIPTTANPWIYSFSLNYGPGPVGTPIQSSISTAKATPVVFNLPGFNDPISSSAVPHTIRVFPVGESPVIFVANRSNTTTGLGQVQASDGSYYARNVWDQHPYPAQANVFPNLNAPPACVGNPSGACHVTRRPLGNLFSGGDCETDSSAFTWPLNPNTEGLRASPPNGTAMPITLWLREPLSGTYNTIEYTEMRLFGTPGGSNGGSPGAPFERPAYISQETNLTLPADNPLNKQCPAKYLGPGEPADTVEGFRKRGIGTGEVFNGAGTPATGGVLNTSDSLAYGFFSFGNVSKLAKNVKYGYLMIDGIDPLFNEYNNTTGNPGQPAAPGTPTTWGELPACTPGGVPDCKASAIWAGGNSYPHLRDGTYPAWSELRMMCDASEVPDHCTVADPNGAQALVRNLQADIHNNSLGGVPDLLPFADGAPAVFGNGAYGDANFVRTHFQYGPSASPTDVSPDDTDLAGKVDQWPSTSPSTNHQGGNDKAAPLDFSKEDCSIGAVAPGTPFNGPTPTAECGGDAGGFIIAAPPAGGASNGNLQ